MENKTELILATVSFVCETAVFIYLLVKINAHEREITKLKKRGHTIRRRKK